MNKKISLFITTAAMLACFVNANAAITYVNTEAPADSAQVQETAPAPEAAPEA